MNIDVYTSTGTKKGTCDVPAAIFDAPINEDLMHRAVLLRNANARNPIAHTKTRAEVVGTTKKAFRQKGTGNARRGNKKTNLLRGGGVTHGPRNTRNFTVQMPKKERRLALFSSLSSQAKDKNIFALEDFTEKTPKTKVFAHLLAQLPAGKKYLFVLAERDTVFEKSAANIPNVRTMLASYLNPVDVLKYEKICFVKKDALEALEKTFLTKTK